MPKKMSQEEVILQFKNIHGDKYGYEKVAYLSSRNKITIYCKKCKEYFDQLPSSHKQGNGCPFCSGNKLNDKNKISTLRPDLIKYFVNEEDVNNYTIGSGREVLLECPNCKTPKKMVIKTLSRQGFSCSKCSDGISTPEKFCLNLLEQLNIEYEKEKKFEWSQNKRYDFYIPSLNTIIETHGEQHFIESNLKKRGLAEEQKNDTLKMNMIKNNIEKYIVVDCRKSDFKHLKENFIFSLKDIFDLSNINWNEIWLKSQKSIIIDVWESWENRKEEDTIKELAKKHQISTATFTRYLKKGKEISKCDYTPGENEKIGMIGRKKVCQFMLDGTFVKEYDSVIQAHKETNISKSGVSNCCNKKQKTAGGFKWEFKK